MKLQFLKTKMSFILLIMAVFTLATGCSGEDGADGIDGTNGQNASGKTYIYLTGNITDAEAAIKLQNDLGSITQYIYIQNTSQLTTVDLTGVTELVELNIGNNTNLTTVLTPDLQTIDSSISFSQSDQVTTLNFPSLTHIFNGLSLQGNVTANSSSLQNINLPVLTYANTIYISSTATTTLNFPNLLEVGNCYINGNSNLTQLLFPELIELSAINYFTFESNNAIATISFPKLEIGGGLYFGNNAALVSIDMPVLTTVISLSVANSSNFTGGVNVPSLNTLISAIQFLNCKLPTSRVNAYLNQFVNITPGLSGIYIDLSNQTPLAPPTGAGITDKATLIANGNTVITD